MHSVHVGRRASQVGNVSFEVRHLCDLPCFSQDGFLAAGCDEFALVGGYCAERASAEASAVHVYGMAYHFICRNWLAFVAWMGEACVWEVE